MATTSSPLLSLPFELRNRIFELYFLTARPTQKPDAILIDHESFCIRVRLVPCNKIIRGPSEDRRYNDWFGSEDMTRLLRVNKLIYAEATKLIYTSFTFCFYDYTIMPYFLRSKLQKFGPIQSSWLTSISLVVIVNEPWPEGQNDGLKLLRASFPNLRTVTFLPLIDHWELQDPKVGHVPQTLKLFNIFSAAPTWLVHVPAQFSRVSDDILTRYTSIAEGDFETLNQELDRHNAACGSVAKHFRPV